MKIISKTLKLLTVFVFVLGFTGCSDDDDNNTPAPQVGDIVEVALGDAEFTVLVDALQRAGLVSALEGPGPLTVLAPTNSAFVAFLNANGYASLDDVPLDDLTDILLNHVINDNITASTLVGLGTGYAPSLAENEQGLNISIYFDATNGVRFNNAGSVVDGGADIDASNGVIHKIDGVLNIPDIADHAIANPNFSSLVTALGAANLVGAVQGPGPLTVLAPTNTAFETFLDGADLGGIPTAVLSNVLRNHVIGASITAGDLTAAGAGYETTLADGPTDATGDPTNISIYFNTSDGVSFNGVASVAIPDVVASNGVIHAIDAVIPIPTVVTFAAADPNFSTLVTALTDLTPGTDFVSILSRTEVDNLDGINPSFTVFAPTNDAFAALAEIPGETVLTEVLLHHVASEANVVSGDLMMGDNPVTMLNNQGITVSLPGTGTGIIADVTDGAGNTDAGIIAVDVQAGNGVIHVLNTVLLPAL